MDGREFLGEKVVGLWCDYRAAKQRIAELERDMEILRKELGSSLRRNMQCAEDVQHCHDRIASLEAELADRESRPVRPVPADLPSDEAHDWKTKVEAAHNMVSALCLPRGSRGSCEWIMRIPADPERDPDLVITTGLVAAEKRVAELEAELADRDSRPVQPSPEPRPVKVRFDVTAHDAIVFWAENGCEDSMHTFMDYLAAHAVIDAPGDLPSDEALAETLHESYCAAWPEHYTGDPSWPKLHDKRQRNARIAQARAAKAVLAQWLRARHIDAAEWRRLWKVGHEEWSRPIGTVESTAITILKALGFTVEVSE